MTFGASKRPDSRNIPAVTPPSYTAEAAGYRFRLDPDGVAVLRTLPDFEGREEPALPEEFLRWRAETWAEKLASAGAPPGEYAVALDSHQRRARLSRGGSVVFSAEI
jgi:hypothetical protein